MSSRFGRLSAALPPAALLAAALLALATQTAAADEFAVDTVRFQIVASEMFFEEPWSHGPTCHVTLSGSLSSSVIEKINGRGIGQVTSASVAECTGGGSVRFPAASFPWRLKYEGYGNALPEIGRLLFAVVGFDLEYRYPAESDCFYLASEATPAFFLLEREFIGENDGRINHVDVIGERYAGVWNTRIVELPCASLVRIFTGRESITPPGSREAIHVTLTS